MTHWQEQKAIRKFGFKTSYGWNTKSFKEMDTSILTAKENDREKMVANSSRLG